ncbi:ATP-binding cassette domain-containing protein [Agromyces luteolus]|uniref:ATP-binding cassette domain-containing protein n=1 Tax=Agromyces luteolus TaxID=88373 RepID=A0A7C9HNL4_9MICO|nr:ATP-binding cassette domain-containing protein [Agromyces luteolus]MUN08622.1 ATP-binding cassette domain-containing protein [Agromyces luteolus]
MGEPLLRINDLVVEFGRSRWSRFRALDSVSLDIHPGETVGLVGESGSGKTTLGRAVLGLAPVTAGTVAFEGRDITRLPRRARRELANDIQVVFQDPYGSLSSTMSVQEILTEPLRASGIGRSDSIQRVRTLLDQVGLPANSGQRYPNEFSGGQRQRIAIARALAIRPRLIVCDEPVSALDLSTQARVLDLLRQIQDDTGVAYLFVSHDLAVVRHLSHRVAVMYRGQIVESGNASTVTRTPSNPYTQRLLLSSPIPDLNRQRERRMSRSMLQPQSA